MKKLLSFLIFILSICCFSCKKPAAFDYRNVKNIRVESLGLNTSKLSMDLVYFNPNNFGVNLKNVDCDLYLDSNYLGKFVLDTMMHIPKSSEFTLPASMQVNMKGLFKNSLSILFNKEVTIGAKGTTRVGKGGFYVTVPFSYEGKQKINFF
ncbi:MAG: type 2 family protein [Segetibacter sp.]|jgi:LEA14-like dessication related protein|nr:type 2 family protein [Segetibacter sp.]